MTELPAPRFPGLAGYRRLAQGCARLGLRHVADLFATGEVPGWAETDAVGLARFLVVDGFRLAQPGNRWRRPDGVVIEHARTRFAERFGTAAGEAEELLQLLRTALAADPDIVRHVLLYQLAALAATPRPGAAADPQRLLDLGVHSGEVDAVRAMVESGTRPSRAASAAAEEVADAFAEGRVCAAGGLLEQIVPDRDDWRLKQLKVEVDRRLGEAGRLIVQGGRLAGEGQYEQAVSAYLQVLTVAADEPRLRDGLVGAAVGICDAGMASGAVPASDASLGQLRATPVDGGIELLLLERHDRPGSDRLEHSWTLLRLENRMQRMHVVLEGWENGAPFIDTEVRFGETVRYVAVPYHSNLICGAASPCGEIRYAPEADGAALRYTPKGVQVHWRRPPRAVSVSVQRSPMPEAGAGGTEPVRIAVRAAADGADDFDVAPGTYQYTIRCGYPASPDSPDLPSTEVVWSPGLTLDAEVRPWPTPVTVLESEILAERPPTLRISWHAPATGTARIVDWQFAPRKPGDDISDLMKEPASALTSAASKGSASNALVQCFSGSSIRFTAVSELDGRALAGPSILIQSLRAPANLWVHRPLDAPGAVVRFDWPEPAVLVAVRWEQKGLVRQQTVARSGYSNQGIRLPLSPSACVITVEPLGRPDATHVFGATASATVPALPLHRRCLRAVRRLAAGARRRRPESSS